MKQRGPSGVGRKMEAGYREAVRGIQGAGDPLDCPEQ